MTISSSGISGVLKAYTGQKVALNDSKDSTKAKVTDKDELVLSRKARDLKRARDIVAKSSPVRKDKVEEITNAIQKGCYQVDPDKVAQRILATVRKYRQEV